MPGGGAFKGVLFMVLSSTMSGGTCLGSPLSDLRSLSLLGLGLSLGEGLDWRCLALGLSLGERLLRLSAV